MARSIVLNIVLILLVMAIVMPATSAFSQNHNLTNPNIRKTGTTSLDSISASLTGRSNSIAWSSAEGDISPYIVSDPLPLPEDVYSLDPWAMNDLGEITGVADLKIGGKLAFIYLPEPAYDLPAGVNLLPTLGGDTRGMGINNLGEVVGWYQLDDGSNNIHGFLWSNGQFSDLGTLGGVDSYARDINDNGLIVGQARRSDNLWRAFSYDGSMQDLGVLPGSKDPDGRASFAWGVNENGQIVGESGYFPDGGENVFRPFIYEGSGMTDLGSLGGSSGRAFDVNQFGVAVGVSNDVNTDPRAFRSDHGEIIDLGTLGGNVGIARAINDAGLIVGNSTMANGSEAGFLWKDGTMNNLNDLIDPESGWYIQRAHDINDNSWILVSGFQYGIGVVAVMKPDIDMVADHLEITQAVQDLNQSVRMVQGKPTFVRFHVHSVNGTHPTTAKLQVQRGPETIWLDPINPGGQIAVRPEPNRSAADHAFLFQLPSEFTSGTILLTGVVNPESENGDRDLLEKDYDNNESVDLAFFEEIPKVTFVIYSINYLDGENIYLVPIDHPVQLMSWLINAYPLTDTEFVFRQTIFEDGIPTCQEVNTFLRGKMIWDAINPFDDIPDGALYYGMVSDGNGFMRGCADWPLNSPALATHVSSGPTGVPFGNFAWDTDSTYGDWYGGHEIGHSLGRRHVDCSGTEGGPDPLYPHPFGSLSTELQGQNAFFGFDNANQAIYDPAVWNDVMTYCKYQWISDYTYEALMDRFQVPVSSLQSAAESANQSDRLLVMGSIAEDGQTISMQPLFVIPDVNGVRDPLPGDYTIVLRDGQATELASYAFTPSEFRSGPPADPADTTEFRSYMINELVPFLEGTTQVDILGPSGLLVTINPGANPPTVALSSPNGNETLGGDSVLVSWAASDPDGDTLSFNLQYSRDIGLSWETVAQNLNGNSIEIDMQNLGSTDQGLFKVWASDGLHTAFDQSDAVFSVPNHNPTVEIVQPAEGVTPTLSISQTLNLSGYAYDIDSGSMDATQLEWHSDIDGLLGNGASLSLTGLHTGTHTITFKADDGQSGLAIDSVKVAVVADLVSLPDVPDQLVISSTAVRIDPERGLGSYRLSVDNLNFKNSISWQSFASHPWIVLSKTAGDTPTDELIVSYDKLGLSNGSYEGTITFTSPDLPDESVIVVVMADFKQQNIFLPLVIK